ncbi:cysteine dioxygenase, partial [Schistosoma bovis]
MSSNELSIMNQLNSINLYQSNKEYQMSMISTLNDFIETIRMIFNEDHIDINEVYTILKNFQYEGNGKYNLLLLCWSEDQGTGVHDHAGADCFVKIIKGQIKETIYEWPKHFNPKNSYNSTNETDSPLVVKSVTVMNPGEVTYMHDKIGIHRLQNSSKTETAITLHLYCPPYTESMNFEESTSKT